MTANDMNNKKATIDERARAASSQPVTPRGGFAKTGAPRAGAPAQGVRAGAGVPHASAIANGSAPSNTRKNVIVVLALVIAALLIWLLVWLFACNGSSLFDPSAQTGQAPYKTDEEIQAELDRVVEEGMFNISIASVIQFDGSENSGTAYIENVPGNRYNMRI